MSQLASLPRRQRTGRILKVAAIGVCVVASIVITAVLAVRFVGRENALRYMSSDGMTLVGEANFDGPKNAPPPGDYFSYDVGGNGWGNGEKQVYTKDLENSRLSGDGNLMLQARRDGTGFTSARLVTRSKVDFGYGLLEARIKLPQGDGLHPAFWLLGSNISTSTNWPECGEIDVIELVNSGDTYHNAVHGPLDSAPTFPWKQSHDGAAAGNLADDFHVYQVYRDPGVIKIGIDGLIVGEYRATNLPPDARWVFDAPMYATFNIAVGGEWPRPVSPSTIFPATMLVDWVRYWR